MDAMKSKHVATFPKGAMKVLMGNNPVAHSGDGKFVAFEVGHCPVISMERQNNDIFFDVDIYDRSNKLIARIAKNEFHVITGESVSVDRQGDLTRLIVKDNSGRSASQHPPDQ